MDFTYDEEQQALREAVRGLVGKAYSDFENRRRTVAAWSRMPLTTSARGKRRR